MSTNRRNQYRTVIPAEAGIQFRLIPNIRGFLNLKNYCKLDPCLRRDDRGFTPVIIVLAVVLILGVFAFLVYFFNQNNKRLNNFVSGDIPPGVVTDADGNICETQDPNYCHDTTDVETWKDDGLP